jgi:hypothetical protein
LLIRQRSKEVLILLRRSRSTPPFNNEGRLRPSGPERPDGPVELRGPLLCIAPRAFISPLHRLISRLRCCNAHLVAGHSLLPRAAWRLPMPTRVFPGSLRVFPGSLRVLPGSIRAFAHFFYVLINSSGEAADGLDRKKFKPLKKERVRRWPISSLLKTRRR